MRRLGMQRVYATGGVALAGLILLGSFLIARRASFRPLAVEGGEELQPAEPAVEIARGHWSIAQWAKEQYFKDMGRVNREVRLRPIPGDAPETVLGLEIVQVSAESPIHQAGFRKDDRILKVNGTPVGTMGRAVNLVHEIKASNKLTVQVQRGDQIIDYRFDFK